MPQQLPPALFATRLCISQHTSAYVSIRQHTSAYVSIRGGASVGEASRGDPRVPRLCPMRQRWRWDEEEETYSLPTTPLSSTQTTPSLYVSIRQHTSAYVGIRQHTSAYVSIRQHTSAYVSIRQHTSASGELL